MQYTSTRPRKDSTMALKRTTPNELREKLGRQVEKEDSDMEVDMLTDCESFVSSDLSDQ